MICGVCGGKYYARGLCKRHYDKQRRRGNPLAPDPDRVSREGPCTFDGCEKPRRSVGLCEGHYSVLRTYGRDALTVLARGRCDACGTTDGGGRWNALHIDHDHDSGVIRGLLCNACNHVLGLVADDADRLRRLADYLDGRLPLSAWNL